MTAATPAADSVCRGCGSTAYQPEAGKDFCLNATRCGENEWTTRELSPSSDRGCTAVIECQAGLDQNGDACTCAADSCRSCTQATDGTNRLLLKIHQAPEMSQLGPVLASSLGGSATDSSYVSECHERCTSTVGCVGFFVYDQTRTAGLRGNCHLASSYNADRIIGRGGGSFYELESCQECEPGFAVDGLSCKAVDQLPLWTRSMVTLSVAEQSQAGAITALQATAQTLTGESLSVMYTLEDVRRSGGDATLFAVDAATGTISTTKPLVGPGEVLLTLRASDNRSSCRTASLVVDNGGCYVETTLRLVVVGFLQTCAPIVYYLPASEASVTLTLAEPELPTSALGLGIQVLRSGTCFICCFLPTRMT